MARDADMDGKDTTRASRETARRDGDATRTMSLDVSVAGERLDKALAALAPELSLRARRRAVECGLVTVNGRAGRIADKVRAGDVLEIAPAGQAFPEGLSCPWPGPGLLAENGEYAAFFKPAGLDCEPLAAKPGPSLAQALEFIYPGTQLTLLTRLDRPTSGLVLAAKSPGAAAAFRRREEAGEVVKTYLALAGGQISEAFTVGAVLDVKNTAVTKVRPGAAPPLRRTRVVPLPAWPFPGHTLVAAVIHKGARHQIRVHLAATGHALAGDTLYGKGSQGDTLYLHHARVSWPGFLAVCPPDWPELRAVIPSLMAVLEKASRQAPGLAGR